MQASATQEVVEQAEIAAPEVFDAEAAMGTFDLLCSQCHAASLADGYPFANRDEVVSLVTRMVDNGLFASEDDLSQVIAYLETR